jgi:hypothetical protein
LEVPARQASAGYRSRPERQRLQAERIEQAALQVRCAQQPEPPHVRRLPLEVVRRLTERAPRQ